MQQCTHSAWPPHQHTAGHSSIPTCRQAGNRGTNRLKSIQTLLCSQKLRMPVWVRVGGEIVHSQPPSLICRSSPVRVRPP
mmetsp:Transcript_48887/g.122441  ORF Transcript_48887/g.122441 Transcript_48887/m.122441 type:complete len:80 (+) Transcript_48887:178-417(+)